jgi:hypothetical protein
MKRLVPLLGLFVMGMQFQDSAFYGDEMFWGAVSSGGSMFLSALAAIGFAGMALDSVRDKE